MRVRLPSIDLRAVIGLLRRGTMVTERDDCKWELVPRDIYESQFGLGFSFRALSCSPHRFLVRDIHITPITLKNYI